MLFESEKEMKEFVRVLAKKMLDRRPLSEWRKIAQKASEVSRKDPYSLLGYSGDPLLPGAYAKALNKMHFAVNGTRPYRETGGGGGSSESREPETGVCVTPNWFICEDWSQPFDCRDPFSCENTGGFSCGGVGFGCYGSYDHCALRFDCGSFGCVPPNAFDEDGCNNFNCSQRYM